MQATATFIFVRCETDRWKISIGCLFHLNTKCIPFTRNVIYVKSNLPWQLNKSYLNLFLPALNDNIKRSHVILYRRDSFALNANEKITLRFMFLLCPYSRLYCKMMSSIWVAKLFLSTHLLDSSPNNKLTPITRGQFIGLEHNIHWFCNWTSNFKKLYTLKSFKIMVCTRLLLLTLDCLYICL